MSIQQVRKAIEASLKQSVFRSLSKVVAAHDSKLLYTCTSEAKERSVVWTQILYEKLYGPKFCSCGNYLKIQSMAAGVKVKHCSSKCAGLDNEVKKRRAKTCMKIYGVSAVQKVKSVRNKFKRTMMNRYGVTCSILNPDSDSKRKQTNLERYGTEHSIASAQARAKSRQTSFERYGTEHPSQNGDIHDSQQRSGFLFKHFTIQGVKFQVRGYEPQAIKWLVKKHGINPAKILTTAARGRPAIKYQDVPTIRYYFPDMYVPINNRKIIAEVKSTYTAGIRADKNGLYSNLVRKAKATVAAGYEFRLLIVFTDDTVGIFKDLHKKTRRQLMIEVIKRFGDSVPEVKRLRQYLDQ